jgi:hypothetical protein
MERTRLYWLLIVGFALILLSGFLLLFLRGDEDTWIKDEKGIWIEHGNVFAKPDYVKEQEEAIACAKNLYFKAKNNNLDFNSQCLGTCRDYSVDIVNVPRNAEDDKIENQCSDFRNKITPYFIEIDKNGNIVRVV